MFQHALYRLSLVSLSCAMLTGCMPKMSIEEMKAAMPQRPAELDKLNVFIGQWEFEGETKFCGLDQVLKSSGTNEAKWDGDGWFLVSRGLFSMGELGEMTGVETWTYDTHDKVYRSTWVDTMGSIGTGVIRHDEKTNTWRVRATSHGPFGKTTGKGKVQLIDDDTMEWTWTEYAMGGLVKTMEMSGTSRRK